MGKNYWHKLNWLLVLIGVFSYQILAASHCLNLSISELQCQMDTTPSNHFDNTYRFNLEVTGGSAGWTAKIGATTYTGSYGSIVSIGPLEVADGPLFLIVYDSLDQSCNNGRTIVPPNCHTCENTDFSICSNQVIALNTSARNLWGYNDYTSFQWYRNSILISGATDSVYTTSLPGTYTVRASNNFNNRSPLCYDESCCNYTISYASNLVANNDNFTNSCPGLVYESNVGYNDTRQEDFIYNLITPTENGTLILENNGQFSFTPANSACSNEWFLYELCATGGGCCDTAVAIINMQDFQAPTLVNVPNDATISCDELIPEVPTITALDNCPSISIQVTETNTQGEDGCSLYDYTLTRTWTATDICGNSASDLQVLKIEDNTAPDIFRIYTLPNGKRMVAGVMENVNQNWKTISLPIDFPAKPLVFTQVVTTEESTPVTTSVQNVSASQFELKLQEEEGEDNRHIRESVAWIAIEEGSQTTNFPFETQRISLTNAWKTVNFIENYTVFPSIFGQMQTVNDRGPAALRFINPNLNSIQLQIEEETSKHTNIAHVSEQVAFMTIEQTGHFYNNQQEIIGETGLLDLNHNWQTITSLNNYYNPVIIIGTISNNEEEPVTARIRNVGLNQFEVRLEEWSYLDGSHANESVSYLIIEGSLPLDPSSMCTTGTDNLELGKDIVAIDNCDVNVSLEYSEFETYSGATTYINRHWSSVDECGNATSLSQIVECEGVALKIKACLQGALLGSTNNLMRDDLRKKGLLPLQEPYSAMQKFIHYGEGGGEKTDTSLFLVDGAKGIVDWVFIELRKADDFKKVVATCSGLIQCDGNIITNEGSDTIKFKNVLNGDYFVTIRHRNHLGLSTIDAYTFSPANIPFVDFTYQFTPIRGTVPSVDMNGIGAMWAGDVNGDQKVIYQGPNNDVFGIFLQVILDNENTQFLSNHINTGYTVNDFNLDGITIYQGPNNDRSSLLFNTILKHPLNDANFSNFIIQVDTGE